MEDEEESGPTIRDNLTGMLIISMLVSYLGYFQYGYTVLVVHNPASHLISNITKMEMKNLKVFWFALSPAVIFFPVGGVTGVVLFGNLVDKYGRRYLLLLNNAFSLLASAFLCLSNIIQIFKFTIFASFITGICAGIFSCCVPIYLLEVSPTPMRGSLTATSVLFFIFGIVIGQILGLPQILGNKEGFPLLAAVLGVIATVCILLLLICPESPRFLFIQMKDETKAREVLKSLRVQEDVEDEIQELQKEDLYEYEGNEKEITIWKLLCMQKFRWPIITVIVFMAGSQLSGINGLFFYAEKIYEAMQLSKKNANIVSLAISVIAIFIILTAINVIETWGRRIPLIMGFMICSMTCILLTFTLEFQVYNPLMAYLSLICIILFLIGYMLGPASIRIVILGELFLQSSRASAYMVGCCAVWFTRVVSGLILIQLELLLGPYSLLVYWPSCVATFIYLFKMIPETKGKSFLEIQKAMAERSAKPKKNKQLEITENS
ncbi:solute carrier family 2, facilitated glucose transporter member 5-like [Python bivittatus]|uniref:Solute carrier family 2, facilitated glucose transporter member 5 n=1 Tax=Python bivittatus TaxID=176946 RepID=A0A9F5ISE6_PYTBI|nr:solute carrier family 2, facilitated glucose transporter member 5-like [Python bivittatus]